MLSDYLTQAQWAQAATLLAENLPSDLPPVLHDSLEEWLARFPVDAFDANPDLLYLQSLPLARTKVAMAATQLLRAILLYRNRGNINRAATCYFELIRIYEQQEDFRTAYLYVGEAEELLRQVTDPVVEARLYLRLAELCPDLGRLRESIDYALQALAAFRRSDELYSQFKTHTLLSILYRQLGDYHAAEAQLEMARRLQQAGRLGDEAYARVLNAGAHLAWYRGDSRRALQQAETLAGYTCKAGLLKPQVYSALLLGNLYRVQGAFATAHRWYGAARTLIEQANLHLFLPWIDVHEGWLYALTGDYVMARKLIHQALTTPDRGQMMSFNVHLALLNVLEAHYTTAESLLRTAHPFYQQSGDELATAVINLYLGYCLHLTNRTTEAKAALQAGLDWLAERHITSFPYWWHPTLVTQVCLLALRWGFHVPLVEHLVVHHLGAGARPALATLLADPDPAVEQRVRPILALLGATDETWLPWLADIADEPVRKALEQLLRSNGLRKEKLPELKRTLTTAQQRDKANLVLIAVFGLYLQDATINEMATTLQRAPASIRNYVTTIYQIFGLSPADFPSLHCRRQHLRLLAQQRGFWGAA